MINKLKKKFTVLATVSMLLLMSALVLMMNIVNYSSVVSECDTILDVLSQPGNPFGSGLFSPSEPFKKIESFIPRGMSPEVPYESRYFSVSIDKNNELVDYDLSQIISVDDSSVADYIQKAVNTKKTSGFVEQFRFVKTAEGDNTRIVFLDCGRKLDSFKGFLWTSIAVGLFGCLVIFVLFLFGAGKIVKPIAESYEKQKRFISDAGHEIKTPLTIINANVDLLEFDEEPSEELTEIRNQTKRLTRLTNDLVRLSKMEEQEQRIKKTELPFSDIVSETVASFRAPAMAKNAELSLKIAEQVSINGSPDDIRQLVCLLLDNAVKYVPEGGIIRVGMQKQKKNATLTVFNTTDEKLNERDLPLIFDRFYRMDASRNSQTGGHGIGLSVAKAITTAHGGSINAATESGFDFTVTVTLPY